jgi:hypothetical protein
VWPKSTNAICSVRVHCKIGRPTSTTASCLNSPCPLQDLTNHKKNGHKVVTYMKTFKWKNPITTAQVASGAFTMLLISPFMCRF